MLDILKKNKLVMVLIVLLLVFYGYSAVRQEVMTRKLRSELAAKEAEIEELMLQKESLEIDIEKATTDEYIERIAREKLKMVKADEIIYVIDEE